MNRYFIETSLIEKYEGHIVLGDCAIDVWTDDECHQVELTAKTSKGYASRKKMILGLANIVGTDEENPDCILIDPKQAEMLIAKYSKEDCKKWFKPNTIDVTTAFALAGNKYGWIADRVDELDK